MKSIAERVLEAFRDEPGKRITAGELARDFRCSYSTARTALKKAFDRGELARVQGAGAEWTYSKKGGS